MRYKHLQKNFLSKNIKVYVYSCNNKYNTFTDSLILNYIHNMLSHQDVYINAHDILALLTSDQSNMYYIVQESLVLQFKWHKRMCLVILSYTFSWILIMVQDSMANVNKISLDNCSLCIILLVDVNHSVHYHWRTWFGSSIKIQ